MQLLRPTSKRDELDSAEQCARELLETVPPITWFIRRHMSNHRSGLSLIQLRTLCLIESRPCASLSAIADNIGATLPTASRMVSGLVESGLVTRVGCEEDRRQVSLELTAKGQEVVAASRRETQKELAAELEQFSPEQREKISEAMGILRSAFGSLSGNKQERNSESMSS
jgi:DNA-binding MarR family transcriptional regulator